MEKRFAWQAKITRSWYEAPDQEQLREELADVSIEVYPEDQVAGAQVDEKSHSAETPAAIILAHSIILANSSKYFRALFTNGMVQSVSVTEDKGNSLTKRRTCVVKIKGYPLPVVEYFLAHLYNNQRTSAIDENTMTRKQLEEALQIADEYGALSFFDHVSYILLGQYLAPDSPFKDVIALLTMAYTYSRETSEILRKGCIAHCGENFRTILGDEEFSDFIERHECPDLLLEMTLRLKKIVGNGKLDSATKKYWGYIE